MSSLLIRNIMNRASLNMSRHVPESDLEDFFRMVWPVTGSWDLIRVGPEGDGGYLVPDTLENIGYCFSPGVDYVAGFEADLSNRGIPSFMADYSVSAPPVDNPHFHFLKKFVLADK